MTSKEKKGLDQWLDAHAGSNGETNELQQLWEKTGEFKKNYAPDVEAGLAKLQAKIVAERQGAPVIQLQPRRSTWRIAAAVALLAVSAFVLKNYFQSGTEPLQTTMVQEGKTSELQLSDGTQISLNQNSRLSYPDQFSGKERKVSLEGEAFFEVAKNPEKPFIIETQFADIQVLGTSFNIRSYPVENRLELLVKTGKVAVTLKSSGERHELLPGEKLVFSPASAAQPLKLKDDSGNDLAWKTRRLRFTKATLGDIFSAVERLYGIRFELENEALKNCRYVASFDAHQLGDVFKAMESSLHVKITEKTEKVFKVKGTGCHQ